jgi:hypothetical protein
MHDETAEYLFREYLERQGWQYWTEAEFRRALGLKQSQLLHQTLLYWTTQARLLRLSR